MEVLRLAAASFGEEDGNDNYSNTTTTNDNNNNNNNDDDNDNAVVVRLIISISIALYTRRTAVSQHGPTTGGRVSCRVAVPVTVMAIGAYCSLL